MKHRDLMGKDCVSVDEWGAGRKEGCDVGPYSMTVASQRNGGPLMRHGEFWLQVRCKDNAFRM